MCFRLLQRSLPFLFKVHFEGCDLSIFSMQKNQEKRYHLFQSISQICFSNGEFADRLLTVCWPFADRLLTVCWRCHACRPHGECFESICLGILFLLPLPSSTLSNYYIAEHLQHFFPQWRNWTSCTCPGVWHSPLSLHAGKPSNHQRWWKQSLHTERAHTSSGVEI